MLLFLHALNYAANTEVQLLCEYFIIHQGALVDGSARTRPLSAAGRSRVAGSSDCLALAVRELALSASWRFISDVVTHQKQTLLCS